MFEKLLENLARELAGRGIPYMVIGGQAVLIYGEPRLTKDIDITVGLGPDGLERVKIVAEALRLTPLVEDIETFVKETMVFPVIEKATGIRVDFIFSFSAYERQAIERAGNVKVGKAEVRVASVEDVIVHKVIAGRPRDLEDVASMLAKNPEYDREYVEKWLVQFDAALGEDLSGRFRSLAKATDDRQQS
jgi:predicted nucleotidyltransferase